MSRFKFPDGQVVRLGQAYARDGVNYPADWLDKLGPEGLANLGLDPVPEPPAHDPRFEIVTETAPGVYDTTPRPLAEVKAARLAELAALRYAKEIGGIVLNNLPIRTDREMQTLISGAALGATRDPNFSVDWDFSGVYVLLTAQQLLGIEQAVRTHVQACRTAQRAHAEAIAALGTVAAVAAYDLATGWPA